MITWTLNFQSKVSKTIEIFIYWFINNTFLVIFQPYNDHVSHNSNIMWQMTLMWLVYFLLFLTLLLYCMMYEIIVLKVITKDDNSVYFSIILFSQTTITWMMSAGTSMSWLVLLNCSSVSWRNHFLPLICLTDSFQP